MDTASHEMLNLLKTRRSVRAYKADPVPEELLDQVLEAGTYAPSAMGRQSPTLIAVTSPKYREQISKLNAAVMGTDKDPYYGAPVIVLALADRPSAVGGGRQLRAGKHDAGRSCTGAFHRVGAREREIFDSEAGKALLREWGLRRPRGVGSIALGYGAAPAPQPKPRKEGYILKV